MQSPVAGNDIVNTFLGSGARIAVNIFLLIGSWFMVDAAFNPKKALKLYLQVAYYCIPVTLIMAFTGHAGGIRNIAQGLLPFFGRPVWFATAYISLMLLAPFLNMAFRLPEKKQAQLAGTLFFLFCIVSTVPSFTPLDYIADLSWFCVVYVITGWVKKNDILSVFNVNKYLLLAFSVFSYSALCVLSRMPAFGFAANYWLDNIKTLPNFACALSLFLFFAKCDIGTRPFVNFWARSVFAVYIVHQIPAFREFEWSCLCHAEKIAGLPSPLYALSIAAVAVAVLATVTLADSVRIKIFDFAARKTGKRSSNDNSVRQR
jgi:hypothetical protein